MANQLDEPLSELLPMPDRPYAGLIKYDARDPEARFPPIEPSDDASSDGDYQFSVDMTNQAIAWVRQQQMLVPDKPFFMYYAPGACHAPRHMPQEWIDNYNGKFEQGWNHVREETPARQEELGVVPPATPLTSCRSASKKESLRSSTSTPTTGQRPSSCTSSTRSGPPAS